MKRYSIYLITCMFFIIASNLFAADKGNFATKGILEFGGTISINSSVYDNSDSNKSSICIGLYPTLNYYFIDNVHIGLVPSFRFCRYDYKDVSSLDSKTVSVGPEFSLGYTFKLSESLFFDLSPFFQYNYYRSYYKDSSFNDKNKYLFYGLNLSLKYNIGNILINTTLSSGYMDYIDTKDEYNNSNSYETSLRLGITAYL